MDNNTSKAGRSILILGASSGIGKACANLLAGNDNTLYLVARNREAMEEMKSKLSGTIHIISYDLNDLDGIKDGIFDPIKKNKIKLNAMVYSAGISAFSPVKVTSVKTMKTVMDVNCMGFCEAARCFYNRSVSEGWGRDCSHLFHFQPIIYERKSCLYGIKISIKFINKNHGPGICKTAYSGKCHSSCQSTNTYGER